MQKNLILLTFAVLIVALSAQLSFTDYTNQQIITLEGKIESFGYSPDQKHFIVLTEDLKQFNVYEGYQIENKAKEIITIDDGAQAISLKSFAFSADSSMLVVGSAQGSIYGFKIENDKIAKKYSWKKNNVVDGEPTIKSISISAKLKVAVGAKDTLVVFQTPTDPQAKEFNQIGKKNYTQTVNSVVWKFNDQSNILVGTVTAAEGIFEQYNWQKDTFININKQKTSSIAVLQDGQVVQGRIEKNIQMYTLNEAGDAYEPTETIDGTVNANGLAADAKGEYFAAVVVGVENNVIAWRYVTKPQEVNLQNSKSILTDPPKKYYSGKGSAFALSGNGNNLLILSDTLTRWALCADKFFYNNNICDPCGDDCLKCFKADTCFVCAPKWYTTVDNKCVSCSDVTVGCQLCSDENTCTKCNDVQHWEINGGLCECQDTYFKDVNQCKMCKDQPELIYCKSCTDATHCKSCNGDDDNHIDPEEKDGHCICINGYYFDDEKVCQDCKQAITGCQTCDAADKCTLCDGGNNFVLDGKGKCQCAEKFFFQEDTKKCVPCSNKVDGCELCNQDGTCTHCSAEKRVPNDDKTACVCQAHTVEVEDEGKKICIDCDPYGKCLKCNPTPPNQCQKCDTDRNRTLQPENGVCNCRKGFVQDDNKCVECNIQGCQDCSIVDKCEKCMTQKHFKQTPQQNVCVCEDNRHLNADKVECWTCGEAINACTQCDNLDECKTCDGERNFELNDKKCQCKSTFFQQDLQCKLCTEKFDYCQTCNADNCDKCNQGFSYNKDEKKCFCPEGREFDSGAGKCEQQKGGLSVLAIIAIIVGVLALAGGAVALIKCVKKRQSPLEDDEYEALEGEKDK